MDEDRRRFLTQIASGAGGAVLLGAAIGGHRVYARSSLFRSLESESLSVMEKKAHHEVDLIPALANEALSNYFHGLCLNVNRFVAEICTNAFAEKLSTCGTDAARHAQLDMVFGKMVATDVEVFNRVQQIAKQSGAQLDLGWARCCQSLATTWNVHLSHGMTNRPVLNLAAAVQPLIAADLQAAQAKAYPLGQRPAASGLLADIGRSAILLLPLAINQPLVGYPVFVITALVRFWKFVAACLVERAGDYQSAISARLATLGNQVGAAFEAECRKRICELHNWQAGALSELARQKAEQAFPPLT